MRIDDTRNVRSEKIKNMNTCFAKGELLLLYFNPKGLINIGSK